MSERDTLAALLHEAADYIEAYCIARPRQQGLIGRLRDAAGVRLAPARKPEPIGSDPDNEVDAGDWFAPAPSDALREAYLLAQSARQAEYERALRAEAVARAAADLIESMSWKAGESAYWVQTLGDDRERYVRLRDAVAVWLAAQPEEAK